MRVSQLKKKISGAILAFSIIFGIGIASSTTAQAQWGNDQWRIEQQRAYEREQRRRQREYQRQVRRQQREAARYGNNGYGNTGYGYGGSYELRQTALNAGYNEGRQEGRNDRSRGERYEYRDEGDYQSASKDYNSRFGDRGLYQQYFRQGFVNGYTDGYRGY